MEPVWIKYYGLVWMTKAGYLIGTSIALSFAAVAFLMAYPTDLVPPFHWPGTPPPPNLTGRGGWFYNHFYDLLALALVAEAIDVVVTLRCFARKEAERRAAGPKPMQPSL
jgi:hypothetical protein